MKRIRLLILISVLFATYSMAEEKPTLILISLDGFRWDYADRGHSPNLDRLRHEGASAISLEPAFPSKTFPNHISIVTGLYPENHGVILNSFLDPFSGERYRLGDTLSVRDGKWYWGEAFWETAERQGIRCASYFWPGSEISEAYRRPALHEAYEHNRPYPQRVEGVLQWLALPDEERPQFITLYFDDVDGKGHRFGPDSDEVNGAIKRVDEMIGKLLAGLSELDLQGKVNIIVVSDHGMTHVNTEMVVNVEELLGDLKCRFTGYGPFMMIDPPPGREAQAYDALQAGEWHYKTYWREDIPDYFHFSKNPFISRIMLISDMGWSVITMREKAWMERTPGGGGNHGFDNHHMDMHGIFYAWGPAFKPGYRTGTVRNVDIYPLMAKLFNILPRQNIDGKLERIGFLLK